MDNINMKTFKKIKESNKVLINGIKYRAYCIGELPANFGTWNFNGKEGIGSWYKDNKRGLIYIAK